MQETGPLTRLAAAASPRTLARILAETAEIAIVIDAQGVVCDISLGAEPAPPLEVEAWRGARFGDIVVPESAAAAEVLLSSARGNAETASERIVHPSPAGNVPVRYVAAALGGASEIVLVGRTLAPPRGQAAWSSDTLYRSLWDLAPDAVLTVEAGTGLVGEVNAAAARLLGSQDEDLRGRRFVELLGPAWRTEASARMRGVLASGRADRFLASGAGSASRRLSVSIEPAQQIGPSSLIVRLASGEAAATGADPASALPRMIRAAADPVVLVDREGTVLWVNDAFLSIAGLPAPAIAVGRPVEDFVSATGGFAAIAAGARRDGRATLRNVVLEAAGGERRAAEATVIDMPDAGVPGFGIAMRLAANDGAGAAGPHSLDLSGLADMIGRTPLKDLVQDTADVVEKICIEAALRLTGNNRSAAARALGLSRQALYLKLRRFGLTEAGED